MAPPRFNVNARAVKRLDAGHPWVFSNELTVPAKELPAGGTVDIAAPDGRFLGRGYANPNALIAVRLVTRAKTQPIDLPGFWAARLREALDLRRVLLPGADAYRLAHGESDGVPGLVIDRYGDIVVARVNTLGMEQRLPAVLEALRDVIPSLTGGLLRNDTRLRELEGLPLVTSDWFGEVPDTLDITENSTALHIHPRTGPGTGHYLDQRDNRTFAASLAAGRTVLDAYAGSGAFGLTALTAGARSATFVDKQAFACECVQANADLNGVADKVQIVQDEARRTLIAMLAEGRRYGMVVLDPPPFAKTKKAAGSGLKGYKEIHAVAMELCEPGGFLVTGTRSQHVFEDRFLEVLVEAAKEQGKRLKMVRRGEQASDHPVLPGMSETRHLQHYVFQVLPLT